MTRQNFLQLALSLSVAGGSLLTGCGGGGGGETVATRAVAGTLALPEGFALPSSALQVATSLGEAAVQASGAFSLPVLDTATSPTLAWARSGDEPLFMGFLSGAGSTLGVRSTAVALLYFALGGYAAPPEGKQALLDLLDVHPATGPLERTLTERLKVNPQALTAGDAAIGAALKVAVDALLAERPAPSRSTRPPVVSRTTRAEGSALLLTSPTTLQSNVELTQGNAAQSVVLTNHSRRYCQVYLYEIGKTPKGGAATVYPQAKILSTTRLSSTRALGIGGTIFGFYSGQTAFVPVSTDPIPLSMATDSQRTEFEAVVLGSSSILSDPPIYSDPHYAAEVEGWRDTLALLNVISWLADVAVALFFELWGIRDLAVNETAIFEAARRLRKLKVKSWRRVNNAIESGNGGLVMQLFLELCISDNEFFRAFVSILASLSPALQAVLSKGVLAASSQLVSKLLLSPLNVAGVILGVGDIGAVLWDLAHAEPVERWNATLLTSDVTLSPARETIAPGDSLALTANVVATPGANIRYKWSLSGSSLANLSDAKEGKAGMSFETSGSVVTLATTPSTQGTLTVTVEATEIASDGSQIAHGQAASQITVNDDVPFGMVRVRFDGNTYLLPQISVTKLGAVSGLAVGTQYQKLSAAPVGVNALKLTLQFAKAPVAVGSTARVADDYDLTLELASSGGSTYFAPSAPATATVFDAGDGYFGYTLNVPLKGLRGVATSGTATFKGWVTGYA